jgi:hypothetical protein
MILDKATVYYFVEQFKVYRLAVCNLVSSVAESLQHVPIHDVVSNLVSAVKLFVADFHQRTEFHIHGGI